MKKHEREKVLSQPASSSCWSRSSYRNFRSHRKGKSSIERERASEKDRERKGGRTLSPVVSWMPPPEGTTVKVVVESDGMGRHE
ncbi:hypothetical protein KFK09_000922 [Dendrobium nobile]|uniref:Uncharacterized protein n=1 Tax=Dendrobium nobile TaxID=94219 RepID=A0A8T3C9X6_DENNO|nr:hypothetical protein KFK09_000922 [Dendrobium nobile]